MAERQIPRLTSRTALRWQMATGVAVVGVVGWLGVTQPENLPFGLALLLALTVLAGTLVSIRAHADPEAGTVARTRWWSRRREVRLREAVWVRLVNNRGGGLNLMAKPPHGSAVSVPVLALTQYVERSQDAEVLLMLADLVERHAPGPGKVPELLRAQAAHVNAGGEAKTSPLAPLVTHSITSAARGGGAAGAGGTTGNLLD